jgi:transglutaminase-like putative cysteine protease
LIEVRSGGDSPSESMTGPNGATALRVADSASLRLRIALGRLPDFTAALPADVDALASTVPDHELPEEVLDFVADLDDQASALERALAIRDFIRARYRYDPGYLEDPSIGHWLARVTRGRAHAHIAALHAAGDTTHLGAGVCYELNALACELLRRAGIPAALATGWVLDGGSLSEPDHLWAIALLADRAGAPVWLPVDASTTRTGRPLRVPRRPPGKFRPPKDPAAKAPTPPRWDTERPAKPAKPKKKKAPPRAELTRLLHYLERITGRPIDPATRSALQRALDDPEEALRLLVRLLGE